MTNCLNSRRHLTTTGDHDGTPAADGWLCRSCTRRLEQRIAELPALYVWLSMNLARTRYAGDRTSGSREAPLPIRLTVIVLLTMPALGPGNGDPISADPTPSIPAILNDCVEYVLEKHQPRLAGPKRRTVDAMAVWLLARLDWIVEQDWVAYLVEDLDHLHSVINATAPRWPRRVEHRPTPCPRCDLRALMWNSRWFECDPREGGCGTLLSYAEYDELCKRWAAWAADQEVAV